ncbi:bifunctional diaminohydroxyphosphoribosylaminopyrimidine deaminase/5-amino-6-(5-phosphoribosylamino)uracil reductase RibD [Spongiibacter sp. KMU-166]|uniref:Riboflavin biosynthesis protein RibD n=1 Tax=Spongiibacter thalassae TaxID=2721624 RepID=A0ABX1GFW9_9GAMM|nr:bifunctional diaminohydroxyphosphoribosylaminopyrimidine deaminase/5-amino-6-(5-phosphoribosylamino)uracil reductase RibD [Spongiibacter thalassae]NKI18107.1 bifunctional diaminohydroxyphosphoribosylaminopyrimidine deaminase/5-amino-6-(5-phosphoribosylamino)uracil reductase RibD [Spongiibacter thalassae]
MSSDVVDREMMARALRLAERGRYSTSPNPRVGCVIARGDKVLAEGWHIRAGDGHAEVNALAKLEGGAARGATAYVTLEPCSHYGRTPPCAEALIKAGLARVVVAMTDPNPLVAGQGIAMLRQAGIVCESGLLEDQARELNRGFIQRIVGGRPWLRAKSAMSLDGRTAMASGESQWITGPEARRDVQRLRAQSCAIISGVDTVLHDDAALTVRPEMLAGELDCADSCRQPLRLIMDSQLRLSPDGRLFSGGGPVIVATLSRDDSKRQRLEQAGAEVIRLEPDRDDRMPVLPVLMLLAERGCNEVMLEAGARLTGSFAQAGLIDEWFVYMAPTLLGSNGRPLVTLPLDSMAQQRGLVIKDIRAVGADWRIHCALRQPDTGS